MNAADFADVENYSDAYLARQVRGYKGPQWDYNPKLVQQFVIACSAELKRREARRDG